MKFFLLIIMIIGNIYAQNNEIKILAVHPDAGIGIVCVDGYKIVRTIDNSMTSIFMLQLRDSKNRPIKCKTKKKSKK